MPASSIASIALRVRFSTTCWIWIPSTSTGGRSGAIAFQPDVHSAAFHLDELQGAGDQRPDFRSWCALIDASSPSPASNAARLLRARPVPRSCPAAPRLWSGRRTADEPPACCERIVLDRRERLIDLMSDRGRHFADSVHAHQMRETLAILSALRCRFARLRRRAPATFAFKQQAGDQRGLKQQNGDCTKDLPAVVAPHETARRRGLRTLRASDPHPRTICAKRVHQPRKNRER